MTTDGKVFANEADAIIAEHDYHLHSMANALAARIKPAYGTSYASEDRIASELLENCNDVLRFADAIRARWPEGDSELAEHSRRIAMAMKNPTAHAPGDGPERQD